MERTFRCARCGAEIPRDRPAFAVDVYLNREPRRDEKGRDQGWLCQGCADLDLVTLCFSKVDDAHIFPVRGGRDEPAKCVGCGQLVALRTDARRERVTCSHGCLVRTSPSHLDRKTLSVTVTECRGCGGPLPAGRPNRRYCSDACRQRSYRRRASFQQT